MRRRSFLQAAMAVPFAPAALAMPMSPRCDPDVRTRWKVRGSEGLDAITFLGPLAGGELYLRYYAGEVAAFAPQLSDAVRRDIAALWREAGDVLGLLAPTLCIMFSADGNDTSIDTVVRALRTPEASILPRFRGSPYWSESDWRWFARNAGRLATVFSAMRDGGFAQFRTARTADLQGRVEEMARGLARFDVIRLHEKLTGRAFDPTIEIVLLAFCKPHGIKAQGQTFLQSLDYDTPTTVRIAAHEMLHPPVPLRGKATEAVIAVLARDPLITRIVREHDPKWGYTTLEGYFDEDLTEALDQLISETLGVARNPADRWRKADDGMHVLAAGLYALLRQDRWHETGGVLEAWLVDAARRGRLAPAILHSAAASVLERSAKHLWPLAA